MRPLQPIQPSTPSQIDVKIDKGVPLPRRGRPVKWPALYTMKIGQSFLFLTDEHNSVRASVGRCLRRTGRHFSVRKVAWNAYRIWRVL